MKSCLLIKFIICLFFVIIFPFEVYANIATTLNNCSVFNKRVQGQEKSRQRSVKIPERIQVLLDKTPAAFGSNCLNTALLYYYENFELRYVGLDEFLHHINEDFQEVYNGSSQSREMYKKLTGTKLVFFENFDPVTNRTKYHAAVHLGNGELIEKRGHETFAPVHKVTLASLAAHSSHLAPIITPFTKVRIFRFKDHRKNIEDARNNCEAFDQDLTQAQVLSNLIESLIPYETNLKHPYVLNNSTVDKAIVLHKKLTNWEEEWIKLKAHCGSRCAETLLKFMSLVEVYPKYLEDNRSEIYRAMQGN